MELHLRFGMHRDIPLIHDEVDRLDGLVIPAHILSYQAASTSVFVTSMHGKPHVVDPMTFMFQAHRTDLENDYGEIRPSIRKLCDAYHEDFLACLEAVGRFDRLEPSGYPDFDEFCDGVLEFQLNHVGEQSASSAAKKYFERYGRTEVTAPRALLPAYWRFSSVGDRWYRMTLRAAQRASGAEPPVMPVLCFELDALADGGAGQLLEDFGEFPGVFIWVDGWSQVQADSEDIADVRRLVGAFAEKGARVEVLYGGFMLMLAEYDGLAAVSHGILYTEHKSIGMTPGGAGGTDRFYIQRLHGFRSLSQADLIVHKHPELLGDTWVCREVLEGNPDNIIRLQDEPELMRRHFLEARSKEIALLHESDRSEIVSRLQETFETYHESLRELPNPDAYVSHTRMKGLAYLDRWADGYEEAV